jgi:hypothetical protein
LLCGGSPTLGFSAQRKQYIVDIASWATSIEQQLVRSG